MKPKHSLVVRPNRAADGRQQLKKRCQGKMDEVILRVLETKGRPPVPADIIKTASNKEYNEDLPYMAAWHALNQDVVRQKKTSVMNFLLIIPYVESLVGHWLHQRQCIRQCMQHCRSAFLPCNCK
jgi:hypothetical protein